MIDKTNKQGVYQQAIQTQHVYAEDAQVYVKKDGRDRNSDDTHVAEWFPTKFKWEPVRI